MREASFNTGKVLLNYAEGPQTGPPLVLLHDGPAGGSISTRSFPISRRIGMCLPPICAGIHLSLNRPFLI
jgi:hypothetical protein